MTTTATLPEVCAFVALLVDAVHAKALANEAGADLVDALGLGMPDRSRLLAALADLRGHHLTDPAHRQLLARAERQIRELTPKGATP